MRNLVSTAPFAETQVAQTQTEHLGDRQHGLGMARAPSATSISLGVKGSGQPAHAAPGG